MYRWSGQSCAYGRACSQKEAGTCIFAHQGSLLRLIRRSNVEPKCGNNSSESLHVFLRCISVLPKFRYRLRTGNGPCSATCCEPAKQYQVSRGRSGYLPRQGQWLVVSDWLRPGPSQQSQWDLRVRGGRSKSRGCYSQPESLWGLDTRLGWESRSCYYQVTR